MFEPFHQHRAGPAWALGAAIVLISCFFWATGCRKTSDLPVEEGPLRIVVKHMRMFGDPAAFDAVLREFEAQYPGVQVISETLPNDSDLQHQFFVTNLEGGSSDFEVLNLDVVWLPEFARAGWLLDLSPWIPPEELVQAHLPGAAEVATWSGRSWAVPWFADAGLLYWRQDLLDKHGFKAPESWEDLALIAGEILKKEADPKLRGFVWQGKQYEGLVCAVLEAVRGFGGEVLNAQGEVVIDSVQSQEALKFLRALLSSGVSPGQVLAADEEVARHQFQQGGAVFMRNWPYAHSLLEEPESPVRGKVGMGPVPAGGGTLGGWQLALNRNIPEHKVEAAVALLRFLSSPEAQKKMLQAYSFRPTQNALYFDQELLEKAPDLAKLKPILSGARPRPVSPYYLMMSQVLQSEFSAAIAGIRTPKEATKRAAKQIEHILGESKKRGAAPMRKRNRGRAALDEP